MKSGSTERLILDSLSSITFNGADMHMNGVDRSIAKTTIRSLRFKNNPVATETFVNASVPSELSINPNPFNPQTAIRFALITPAKVSVAVYDMVGKKVKTVNSALLCAGDHTLFWNGENSTGKAMPAGVYNIVVQTPSFSVVKKATLLK